METIEMPTVAEEPQPVQQGPGPEDDPTEAERRELLAQELREAILRKVRPRG